MKLYAFQGYRYNSATVEAALQAAPPFDQIDESLRDRLHAQSPHQFARVTKPIGHGDLTPHEHSVALHREWIENGVVARDETPSVYPYAITQPDGSSRLGLCALVGVEPGREGDLWPHEQTVAKSIAERLGPAAAQPDRHRTRLLPRRGRRHAGTSARRGLQRRRGRCPGQPHGSVDGTTSTRSTGSPTASESPPTPAPWPAPAPPSPTVTTAPRSPRPTPPRRSPQAAPPRRARWSCLTSLASANLRIDPVHRGVRVPVNREAMSALPLRERAPSGNSRRSHRRARRRGRSTGARRLVRGRRDPRTLDSRPGRRSRRHSRPQGEPARRPAPPSPAEGDRRTDRVRH